MRTRRAGTWPSQQRSLLACTKSTYCIYCLSLGRSALQEIRPPEPNFVKRKQSMLRVGRLEGTLPSGLSGCDIHQNSHTQDVTTATEMCGNHLFRSCKMYLGRHQQNGLRNDHRPRKVWKMWDLLPWDILQSDTIRRIETNFLRFQNRSRRVNPESRHSRFPTLANTTRSDY